MDSVTVGDCEHLSKVYLSTCHPAPTCFYSGVSFVGALILRLGSILPREGRYLFSLATELARVLEDGKLTYRILVLLSS